MLMNKSSVRDENLFLLFVFLQSNSLVKHGTKEIRNLQHAHQMCE